MYSELLQKAKLNAFFYYVNIAITLILVFFISPYLIRYLGSYSFGVWKYIQKILTFATVADGRATQALKWVIANDEGEGNSKIKQQAIGSSLRVWMCFSPFMLLIIGLLVWNLPHFINDLDTSMYQTVYLVGFILGANMMINPLLAIPDAILIGTNQGYRSTSIQTFGVIISNCSMIAAAYLGYGISGLATVVLLVTALNALFIYYMCKRNVSWFGVQKPTKEQLKNFFGFSIWVFLWSFVEKLILSTEILVLGFLINPEMVSNYVFTAYTVQLAISVSLITGSAMTPGLGKVIGSGDFRKGRGITKGLRELILFIAALFGGVVLLLNKDFVSLWMGENYFIGVKSNFLIVLVMTHLIMFRIEGQIQDLSLKIKNKVLYGAFFAILCLCLATAGYHLLENSIEGAFLGILVGRVLHFFKFRQMTNKMLQINESKKPVVYLYLYMCLLFLMNKTVVEVDNWFAFVLKAAIVVLGLLVACYYLFLSNYSKEKLLSVIGFLKKGKS